MRFLQYSRETLVGAGLALVSVVALAILPAPMQLDAATMLLILIAAIYIGFALSDRRPGVAQLEIAVAAGSIALALIGLWLHPLALVVGYILHGIWDLFHHDKASRPGLLDGIRRCASFTIGSWVWR